MASARGDQQAGVRPPFVVTGAPRSGTLFVANALEALGVACGHERIFTPSPTVAPSLADQQGDVSWLAAPFLHDLPDGAIVFHQVREPLAVLRSLIGQRFLATAPHPFMEQRYRLQKRRIRFARPITNPAFVRYAARHCPAAFSFRDELTRAAYFWVEWNQMIERAASLPSLSYHRHRVESLDDNALAAVCDELRHDVSLSDIAAVRAQLGTTTHRARPGPPVRLDDVTDEHVRDGLRLLAARYGYQL